MSLARPWRRFVCDLDVLTASCVCRVVFGVRVRISIQFVVISGVGVRGPCGGGG